MEELQALPLPPGITTEQAISVIEATSWAQDSAQGVINKLGLTGDQAVQAKKSWANALARGMVRSMVQAGVSAPATPPPPPSRRRVRQPPATPSTQISTQISDTGRKHPILGRFGYDRPRLFRRPES